jgi:hypothetical protein
MARSAVARPFRACASAPASSSGSSSTFADNGAGHGRLHYFANLAADIGLANVPMTDEARKIHAARGGAPVPFRIVQNDTLVVIIYESFETRGLNGRQWLDHGGLPSRDKLTVIERFRRPSYGRLEIESTITDPTYYTRPWNATASAQLLVNTELFEFICNENEKSTQHMGPHMK